MAVDPVIQELLDLIEPPQDGRHARPTSGFGRVRNVGTSPHGGFDVNRGRGVLPNGRVTSPIYGKIKKIDPSLGRVVIEERDPVSGEPTGYDVEILHTQTQTVQKDDPVKPTQQIGTQGDVGAPGAFHAHIQVYHGDRTPLNPLRHLFEYHHPGEPIPPLPQFEPLQLPPREQGGPASTSGGEGSLPSQLFPGMAIPGAVGSTSVGGPAGPTPLVPPVQPRSQAPGGAPSNSGATPLNFAPQPRQNFGPFTLPESSRPDASGGIRGRFSQPGNAPILEGPAFGAPRVSGLVASPGVPGSGGSTGQIGDGNGIGNWWTTLRSVPQAPSQDAWANIPKPRLSPPSLPGDPASKSVLVRAAAAAAGVPNRNNVFEDDVPEAGPTQSSESGAASVRRLSSVIPGLDLNRPPPEPGGLLGIASGEPNSPSPPLVPFPLEALFAPDRNRALDDWAASSPRSPITPPAQDAPGGFLGLLAAAAGIDPSHPFQPTPPVDPASVRRLVGRRVQ